MAIDPGGLFHLLPNQMHTPLAHASKDLHNSRYCCTDLLTEVLYTTFVRSGL